MSKRLCALWVILCIVSTNAFIRDVDKSINGAYVSIIKKSFGLAEKALFSVDYFVKSNDTTPQAIVLVLLLNANQLSWWYETWLDNSPEKYISYGCNLPSMGRWQIEGSGNITFQIRSCDEYVVLLLQCSNTSTTVKARFTMVNPTPEGHISEHLPMDKVMYPAMYSALIMIYTLMLAAFVAECFLLPSSIKHIHYVMGATCAVKMIQMWLSRQKYISNSTVGQSSDSLLVSLRLFEHISDSTLILSLLLVAMGWTITRPVLYLRELRVVGSAAFAYLILGSVASPCVLDSSSSSECNMLYLVAYVIRCLFILSIIVSMNFTHTQTRAYLSDVPWTPDVVAFYARLKQYQTFRWMFLCYLLSPVVIIIIKDTTLEWEYKWVSELCVLLTDVAVYCIVGVSFKPMSTETLLRPFGGPAEPANT